MNLINFINVVIFSQVFSFCVLVNMMEVFIMVFLVLVKGQLVCCKIKVIDIKKCFVFFNMEIIQFLINFKKIWEENDGFRFVFDYFFIWCVVDLEKEEFKDFIMSMIYNEYFEKVL